MYFTGSTSFLAVRTVCALSRFTLGGSGAPPIARRFLSSQPGLFSDVRSQKVTRVALARDHGLGGRGKLALRAATLGATLGAALT